MAVIARDGAGAGRARAWGRATTPGALARDGNREALQSELEAVGTVLRAGFFSETAVAVAKAGAVYGAASPRSSWLGQPRSLKCGSTLAPSDRDRFPPHARR